MALLDNETRRLGMAVLVLMAAALVQLIAAVGWAIIINLQQPIFTGAYLMLAAVVLLVIVGMTLLGRAIRQRLL